VTTTTGGEWRDTTPGDEDRLPWLEAADAYDDDDGVSVRKLATMIIAALVALGIVIGGIWWLRSRSQPVTDPTLIAAQEGDYKVRPDAPGGMKVEGKGDSAFAASEGAEAKGKIDTNQLPESPVKGQRAAVATSSAGTTANTTVAVPRASAPLVARPPVTAAAPARAGSGTVQLGAFGSQAKADTAWASLSRQFPFLGGMQKSVVPAEVGGATVYRLRVAAGGNAATVCARLKAAGENCIPAN
jgi:SPOR domain